MKSLVGLNVIVVEIKHNGQEDSKAYLNRIGRVLSKVESGYSELLYQVQFGNEIHEFWRSELSVSSRA